MERATRRPGRPAKLSRDLVASEALALADAEGLAAVSMRRLAARLSVDPKALYGYVVDKDDLVAALVDRVVRQVEVPRSGDWRDDLRAFARLVRTAVLRRPYLVSVVGTRSVSPSLLALVDRLLVDMRDAGVPVQQAMQGLWSVTAHTLGHVLLERAISDRLADRVSAVRRSADSEGLELLTAGLDATTWDPTLDFEAGLEAVIQRIGSRLQSAGPDRVHP